MGHGKMSAAIADAGPLIHLYEIGSIQTLALFDALHIPDAVWRETAKHKRVPSNDVMSLNNVKRHTVSRAKIERFVNEAGLEELHEGELECLYLGRQLEIATLLTDDMAVRDAAKRLHLTPVGSLGLIVKAYHKGVIPLADAERHLNALYDISSLFVTRAIVDIAIEEIHRLRK